LGDDLGRAAALDGGGGGHAEDVGVQLGGRRELGGLRNRRDEDDLVLLGHHGDRRPLGGGQRADQEVHVVFQDQLARLADRFVGVGLGVAGDQLELAAEHAAPGVDL